MLHFAGTGHSCTLHRLIIFKITTSLPADFTTAQARAREKEKWLLLFLFSRFFLRSSKVYAQAKLQYLLFQPVWGFDIIKWQNCNLYSIHTDIACVRTLLLWRSFRRKGKGKVCSSTQSFLFQRLTVSPVLIVYGPITFGLCFSKVLFSLTLHVIVWN